MQQILIQISIEETESMLRILMPLCTFVMFSRITWDLYVVGMDLHNIEIHRFFFRGSKPSNLPPGPAKNVKPKKCEFEETYYTK